MVPSPSIKLIVWELSRPLRENFEGKSDKMGLTWDESLSCEKEDASFLRPRPTRPGSSRDLHSGQTGRLLVSADLSQDRLLHYANKQALGKHTSLPVQSLLWLREPPASRPRPAF